MGALEPGHLVLILLIVLLIFGPGKLSSIGADVGKAVREFRKATEGANENEGSKALAAGTLRTCASCGGGNLADATFCTSCGTRLAQHAGT